MTQPYLYNGLISGRAELTRPKTVPKIKQDPTLTCEHSWKRYKKPLPLDNIKFKHLKAFFIVRACNKCCKIEYLDYHIEK